MLYFVGYIVCLHFPCQRLHPCILHEGMAVWSVNTTAGLVCLRLAASFIFLLTDLNISPVNTLRLQNQHFCTREMESSGITHLPSAPS